MWRSSTFLNGIVSDTIVGLRGPKSTKLIYRDELSKKPSRKQKRDNLAIREPLPCSEQEKKDTEKRGYGSSVEEKGVIRVKVKMTKQEAARLLSKCKDGGLLEFRDVAHELVQIPINRVSIVSFDGGCGGMLKSIPEETHID